VIHLIAGGTAGTTGAVLTCPLEVVKTRLQSSVSSFVQVNVNAALRLIPAPQQVVSLGTSGYNSILVNQSHSVDIHSQASHCKGHNQKLVAILRHIIKTEGIRGLFKGLGPTVIGVAPSRAIYFSAYANSKPYFNLILPCDSHAVNLCAAATAGILANTLTNPIWFVKTRLQLDQKVDNRLTVRECVRRIYAAKGLRGFYKGLTASYYGVSETVVHLVIYEALKAKLLESSPPPSPSDAPGGTRLSSDYLKFMLAGATSKTIATVTCYPHEVARTRMREPGNKYRAFAQTLRLVLSEEGHRGLYRGLATQLIRQIPNTAIVMATYEFMVHQLNDRL